MRSDSSPFAVSRMIAVRRSARSRTWRMTSRPSMPGIIRSRTIRSGRSDATAAIACGPSAATRVS